MGWEILFHHMDPTRQAIDCSHRLLLSLGNKIYNLDNNNRKIPTVHCSHCTMMAVLVALRVVILMCNDILLFIHCYLLLLL
jgi:hypothetical protein